jgi:DNA primase
MNILDLLAADGIKAKHASRGEWHSPCPECGGVDRFSTWPDKQNSNGKYYGGRGCCRRCGFNGDAVNYLRKRRAMTFLQAVNKLGIDPGPMPEHRTPQAWQPAPSRPAPVATWQDKARAFMNHCTHQLQRFSEAMDWLQAERGMKLETIRDAGLGWNPVDLYQSRTAWGLPQEKNQKTGRPKRLWIPAGLLIPCLDDDGSVIRIRIRRHDPGEGSRYIVVSGSNMQPMISWKDHKAACVVESELDALLLNQEAGDLIGTIALGSAQQKPDSDLHRRLMAAERVLVCLDNDDAGRKAAWGHWRMYPGFRRWPTVSGKDPGDMNKVGIPVKTWIQAGLF